MARKVPFKKIKLEDRIMNEVNVFLRQEISDARLQFVSVTKVELNNDFSQAKLYWDTFDATKKEEIEKAMEGIKGKVRNYLSQILTIRQVPNVHFVYDGQYEAEMVITKILQRANAENLNENEPDESKKSCNTSDDGAEDS